MKKLSIFSVILIFIVSSCSMYEGLKGNRPGKNLKWSKNLSSQNDQNQIKSIEKKDNNTVLAKNIASTNKSNVVSDNITNSSDLASNKNDIGDYLTDKSYSSKDLKVSESVENLHKSFSSKQSFSKNKAGNLKTQKIIKKELKDDVSVELLYVLCFFIPFFAVGLATNWDLNTVFINLLWTLLCGIPGIIHAIIVVRNNS